MTVLTPTVLTPTPTSPAYPQAQVSVAADASTDRRILDGLAHGKNRYDLRTKSKDLYHVKSGHLSTNIMLGCCGQCYKYDLDFIVSDRLLVTSTVPCNGWWGGVIGARLEKDEKQRIANLLAQAFPERQVVIY